MVGMGLSSESEECVGFGRQEIVMFWVVAWEFGKEIERKSSRQIFNRKEAAAHVQEVLRVCSGGTAFQGVIPALLMSSAAAGHSAEMCAPSLPSQWPCELATVIVPILEMRKLRLEKRTKNASEVCRLGKAGLELRPLWVV